MFEESVYPRPAKESDDLYITIGSSEEGEKELATVIQGRAPVLGVEFSQEVDVDLNKAISGSWLVNAFGHRPVKFTISGMEFWGNEKGFSAEDNSVGLQTFYSKYNVYKNPNARLAISLVSQDGEATVYIAILVGLTRSAKGSYVKAGTYGLSFIGINAETE